MPSLLADTYHHVKVVANNIFSILNNGKAQRCGCTKSNALRINKDWGCTIKNNINKSLEKLRQASKLPLGHMFKNHDSCRVE